MLHPHQQRFVRVLEQALILSLWWMAPQLKAAAPSQLNDRKYLASSDWLHADPGVLGPFG